MHAWNMPTIYNMSKPYLKQLWNNMCNTCSYIVQAYSTHVIPRHVQRACIYACMIMHACMACMHSCMQACVHTLIHTSHEPISMHACMHGCRQSCMHACMHACLHAHVHVCTTHDPTFFLFFPDKNQRTNIRSATFPILVESWGGGKFRQIVIETTFFTR